MPFIKYFVMPTWRRGLLVATRMRSSFGTVPSTMPSAAKVSAWGVDAVANFAKVEVGLEPDDVDILVKRRVSGKALLRLDEATMERAGFSFDAIAALLPCINTLRTGGPKMVFLANVDNDASAACEVAFETQEELKEFLDRQRCAGLRDGDGKVMTQLDKLKPMATYTVSFVTGSFMQRLTSIPEHKEHMPVSRIYMVKRAVEEQSKRSFGTMLKADPRDCILLVEGKTSRGDVDSLFKGDGLHVLMERKSCITSHSDADKVISQVQKTVEAYVRLNKHMEGGAPCDVKCIVYADAMSLEAEAAIRRAGIYVLRHADLGVLAPSAPAPAPAAPSTQ